MVNKIVILRGINVGGKRKLLMADLKLMMKDLGHTDILTYIQSGNIIFKSNAENKVLEEQIEKAIRNKFGFDVPVIIRTPKELENSIRKNPFYNTYSDIDNLYFTFLKEKPNKAHKQHTETYNYEPDKFVIEQKDVFIFCEGKYHQSKLSNNFFEKKLNVGATTRNCKTVLKLMELASI